MAGRKLLFLLSFSDRSRDVTMTTNFRVKIGEIDLLTSQTDSQIVGRTAAPLNDPPRTVGGDIISS